MKRKKLSPEERAKFNQNSLIQESRCRNAVGDIREKGISSREAAEHHGVQRSTVYARHRGREPITTREHGQRKFSDAEELVLKTIIVRAAAANKRYDKQEIKDIATEMYQKRINDPEARVGEPWFKGFMSRHLDLKYVYGRNLDYKRNKAQKPQVIVEWCELVRKTIQEYHIHPNDVYNFDESGFQLGDSGKTKVVTSTEFSENPSIVTYDNREWVTAIECIGAAGQVLSPYIIFKSRLLMDSWFENLEGQENWRFDYSPEGWTNNEIAVRWLTRTFLPQAATWEGEYVLLVFDGHESHYTRQFVDVCDNNKIIMLCMPLHSSHRLQPLEVGCFPVLKGAWRRLNRKRARYAQVFIKQEGFIRLYNQARLKTFTKENIKSSFLKAGVSPLDPQRVIKDIGNPLPPPAEEESQIQEFRDRTLDNIIH